MISNIPTAMNGGIDHKHSFEEHYDWGDGINCGKCGHTSYWNYVAAPVAFLCDENGNPIKEE